MELQHVQGMVAGRREKEKGIDNPQAIPSRKIKKRWTKGKQSTSEKYAGYGGRIRWKGWPTRTQPLRELLGMTAEFATAAGGTQRPKLSGRSSKFHFR